MLFLMGLLKNKMKPPATSIVGKFCFQSVLEYSGFELGSCLTRKLLFFGLIIQTIGLNR